MVVAAYQGEGPSIPSQFGYNLCMKHARARRIRCDNNPAFDVATLLWSVSVSPISFRVFPRAHAHNHNHNRNRNRRTDQEHEHD
jgi:hypothetical protein